MPRLLEVKLYGSKVLANKAHEVEQITPEIKSLIEDMIFTMYHTEGVGIAAPQVGVPVRIFVCDPEYTKSENKNPIILINPEFIEFEGEYEVEEGCLSVPGIYEKITRFKYVTIKYRDENWKECVLQAEDTFAVILQHEFDHLQGISFVDKITPIRKMAIAFRLNRIIKKAHSMADDIIYL